MDPGRRMSFLSVVEEEEKKQQPKKKKTPKTLKASHQKFVFCNFGRAKLTLCGAALCCLSFSFWKKRLKSNFNLTAQRKAKKTTIGGKNSLTH